MLTENDIRAFVKTRVRDLIDNLVSLSVFVNDFEYDLDISIEIDRVIVYNKEASESWEWFDEFFDDQAHGFGTPKYSKANAVTRADEFELILLKLYRHR